MKKVHDSVTQIEPGDQPNPSVGKANTKEHVLRTLEESRGTSVSGAQLAACLSLSRAAVWKAISELREEGYDISAVTNKGYSLSSQSDVLSPQGIAAFLRHREIAELIHTYPSVESTNLTAKQMAAAGAPHGTVIAALTQTAGRGRLGRSFYSPKGAGVYLSILLRPHTGAIGASESPFNPVLVTTAAAVAAARAVSQVSGREVQIKWVNDLYLDGKKICGILTEGVSNLETGAIESIIIGIGINCFMPSTDYPDELQARATSLFAGASSAGFTKNALIAAVADHVLDIQFELADGRFLEEYRRRSLVLGKEIYFYPSGMASQTAFPDSPPPGGQIGRAVDIDDFGGLIVKLPDGSRRTLSTGEISIRTVE